MLRPIPTDQAERLSALAETFPSLRGAPGVRPFDPERLTGWEAISDDKSATAPTPFYRPRRINPKRRGQGDCATMCHRW